MTTQTQQLNSQASFAGDPFRIDSDAILNYLTHRQHVAPHTAIADVLAETTQTFGCCPNAIARAVAWLGTDGGRSIGRLRRSELIQLARSVHRFWTQAVANSTT